MIAYQLKKIDSLTLATILAYIAMFGAAAIPQTISLIFRTMCLVLDFFYITSVRKRIHLYNISTIYSCSILISSIIAYFKGTTSFNNLVNSLFYCTCLFIFCELMQIWSSRQSIINLVQVLFKITVIYCAISYLSVFYLWDSPTIDKTYFFGAKFVSSYYFIFALVLFLEIYRSKTRRSIIWKSMLILMFASTLLFTRLVGCTTVTVITIIIAIMFLLERIISVTMSKRIVVISFIIASGFILFFLEGILSTRIAYEFIVNVLHKDISLSYRMPIYTKYLFPMISKNVIWGYGYGSSPLHSITPYWNAQNGFFDIVLNFGFVGILTFLITAWTCLKPPRSNDVPWGLYLGIYSMIFAATIEVSFNNLFLLLLYLVMNYNKKNKNIITLK